MSDTLKNISVNSLANVIQVLIEVDLLEIFDNNQLKLTNNGQKCYESILLSHHKIYFSAYGADLEDISSLDFVDYLFLLLIQNGNLRFKIIEPWLEVNLLSPNRANTFRISEKLKKMELLVIDDTGLFSLTDRGRVHLDK